MRTFTTRWTWFVFYVFFFFLLQATKAPVSSVRVYRVQCKYSYFRPRPTSRPPFQLRRLAAGEGRPPRRHTQPHGCIIIRIALLNNNSNNNDCAVWQGKKRREREKKTPRLCRRVTADGRAGATFRSVCRSVAFDRLAYTCPRGPVTMSPQPTPRQQQLFSFRFFFNFFPVF